MDSTQNPVGPVSRRRVLVTGSRTWTSAATIRDALERVWGAGDAVLVTGGCPTGADRIAEMFWRRWGGKVEQHPAEWDTHGRAAGPRRNAAMVETGAEVCLAFIRDGSAGASHTAELARAAGIPTQVHAQASGRPEHQARPDPPPDRPPQSAANVERPTHVEVGQADAPTETQTETGRGAGLVEFWSPAEIAAQLSYPQIGHLVAHAPPGSDLRRAGLRAIELVLHDPGIYRGDQLRAIAEAMTPAQIAEQRRLAGHGPLFELFGQAAALHSTERAPTAGGGAADRQATEPRPAAGAHDGPVLPAAQVEAASSAEPRPAVTGAAAESPGAGGQECRRAVRRAQKSIKELTMPSPGYAERGRAFRAAQAAEAAGDGAGRERCEGLVDQ